MGADARGGKTRRRRGTTTSVDANARAVTRARAGVGTTTREDDGNDARDGSAGRRRGEGRGGWVGDGRGRRVLATVLATATALAAGALAGISSTKVVYTPTATLATNDRLGCSVGIAGDTAVIGARGLDNANGKAFVAGLSSGAWSEIAKLSASTGGASGVGSLMNLGDRVVMNSNGIIAVSAPNSKVTSNSATAGAVFVYARPQAGWTGSLTQSETVLSQNPEENGFFGTALAISQDYLIVGAYGEGSGEEGRVYIYGYTSGSPLYSHNFTIPNDLSSPGLGGSISNGEFGKAVAISDTMAFVGAPVESSSEGAVYAYTYDGTYWVKSPVRCGPGVSDPLGTCNRLPSGAETALPIGSNYEFGTSIALAGDWLFVGAPGATVGSTPFVGAVYVYKKSSSGTWDFNTALKPNSTYAAQGTQFGRSISVSGNHAIVGSVLNSVGRMFVYKLGSGAWSEIDTFQGDGPGLSDNEGFSGSLAISSDYMAVGAPLANSETGKAYFYELACDANYRVSSGECVACATGYTNAAGDLPTGSDTQCDTCAANYRVSSSNTCVACPGSSTNVAGDDSTGSATACDCPTGYQWNTGTNQCDLCAANYRVSSSNTCVACPGSSTNTAGDDSTGSATACDCPTGYQWNVATTQCDLCAANYRVSSSNTCVACPGSSTNTAGDDSTGSATACDCPTGYQWNVATNQCDLCAANYRVSSGACAACLPGYLNDAGDSIVGADTQCDKCAANYYVATANSGACTACPTGTTNAAGDVNTGSVTDCDCPSNSVWNAGQCECTAGYRVDSNTNTCTICGAGYTNAAGDVVAGSSVTDTQCDLCAANYRVSSSNTCVACPGSSTNTAGDDSTGSATACDCPTGYQWNVATTQCDLCAANYRVSSSNTCVACPGSSTNTAGDDSTGSATACDCPTGYQWNVATTQCDLCAANYRVSSSNTCVACPGSSTNTAGDDSTGSATACDCPTGYQWNAATTQCDLCAANYRVSSGACAACLPGYLNDAGDSIVGADTQCDKCAANYYVATANSGACTACPTGTTNAAGDVNTGSVTDCDCPSNSVWNAGQCECTAGYRVDSNTNTCTICGAGYTNAAGDVVAGSSVTDTQCDLCAANYRVSSSNTCVACPGSSTNTAGDDSTGSATACDCPTGYQWNVATTQCDLCAANYRVSSSNTCVACPGSSTNTAGDDSTGSATACDCPTGYQWNVATNQCDLCAANYRVSSGACAACLPGYLNDAGDSIVGADTQCDKCAANYYVATANSGACTACPTGTTNAAGDVNTGSVTDCDCPSNSVWNAGQCECTAGYRVDSNTNTCTICGAGYTNAAGDVVAGSSVTDTQCDLCAANYRVSSSNTCVACPGSSTNTAGDDSTGSATACDCPTGYQWNAATTQCDLCAANYRVSSGACVACTSGYVRNAGDSITGGDTTCAAGSCDEGYHVSSSVCVQCPAGESRAAGDAVLGGDTACDKCAANYRASSGSCVACATGYANAALDLKSSSTTCDLCASNYYVATVNSGACEPCPTGTTNAAGDVNTGSVTGCDCPTGSSWNAGTQSCDCPLNSAWNAVAGQCECTAGYRVDSSTNTCTICGAGYTNAAGDVVAGSSVTDTQCDLCAANYRVSSSNTCVACPGSSTNTAGDDSTGSATACDCPTGYQWNAATTQCDLCAANYRVSSSNTCVACPGSSTNTAGDDSTGSATACDCPTGYQWNVATNQCDLCAANYRVSSSNTCVACPGSSTNTAGDVSAGSATACDCPTGYQWNAATNQCDVCAANYRVSSGACAACTSGYVRNAGDSITGGDTTCVAGSCDEGYHVSSSVCVQCPAGESRAAGDAVLGGDTACDKCAANYRASSGSCVACATGYANAALDLKSSSTTCDLCASNYYVATANSGACEPCPTGTTNAAGDVNTGSVTGCDCPTGSSWNAGTQSCDCPLNSAWNAVAGQCECTAGYRVDSSTNECVACVTGYTNAAGDVVAGSGVTDTQCDLCAANYRVSSGACAACLPGYLNDAGDSIVGADTQCDTCALNYFASAANTCTQCPGSSTNAAGDANTGSPFVVTACDCPTGYQWNAATNQCDLCTANYRVSSGACAACTSGYVRNAGDSITGGDTTCVAGSCDEGYHVSSSVCVQCPAGESRAAGDAVLGGDTACDKCAANYRASSGSCVACATGYANAALDLKSSSTTCDLCASNYYVATANSGACEPCPTGTTNAAGDVNTGSVTGCDCPTGSSWNAGTQSCDCPLNSAWNAVAGQCECTAGYRVDSSTNACVTCGAGYTNAAGDVVAGSGVTDTQCNLCASNYYVATANSGACEPCPTGTTNAAGDVNTGSVTGCDCPTGSSWNAGTQSCDCPLNSAWNAVAGQCECTAGYRVDSSTNACVACVTGYTNAAGDVVAGSGVTDTQCDLCAANYHVSSGACAACLPGYLNDAGDSIVGADTQCDKCALNYYVATANSGECTPCPTETTNAAGDDNTGVSTTCDAPPTKSNRAATLAAAIPSVIAGVVVLGSISGFVYWRHQVGAKRRLAGLRMLESEGATAGYSRGSLQQFNPGLGRRAATEVSSGLISTRFLSPTAFAPATAGATAGNVTVAPSTHFMSVAHALRALHEVPPPPYPRVARPARLSRDAPAPAPAGPENAPAAVDAPPTPADADADSLDDFESSDDSDADSLDDFESSDDSDADPNLSESPRAAVDASGASDATALFRL